MNYTKKDFYCFQIKKHNELFVSVFENKMIQHAYGWSLTELELHIRPYSNNKIDEVINQFNFWLEVFNYCINGTNSDKYLSFKSLNNYNNFVDEVFRLISLYPKYNTVDNGVYLWENKKICKFKKFPKNVIQISDIDSNCRYLKFDENNMCFSHFEIEKHIHNYQNNNSMYILDISLMKKVRNPHFNNDNISSII